MSSPVLPGKQTKAKRELSAREGLVSFAHGLKCSRGLVIVQVQVVDSDQGRMARPRMLPPGQRVDVWLELEMPKNHGSSNGDIFQAWSHALPTDACAGTATLHSCTL